MKLDKTYQPQKYEQSLYQKWENSGAFKPHSLAKKQAFSVVLPPPNANADLHLGYALDAQLKDIVGRWQRLKGKSVLLLPGADHAGFETWAVYEKHLNALGQSRFDVAPAELYKQVHDFVIENMTKMKDQIRRLGISCDWEKFTFSLDDQVVKTAYQTFHRMWKEGLIYRGKRLVNYCVQHGTGFSDIEISYEEVNGKLWFIKYPLADNEKEGIVVATTRPETMLGDVAVAVHPDDQRYHKYHQKTLKLPLTDREIPLILDDRVLTDFGTGAVKITPAHDFLDFEIAQDNQLASIEVINQSGQMTDQVPEIFRGLTTAKARQLVIEKLKLQNYLVKEEDYLHQVGHCYKCHTVLEPLLADQWFVHLKPLAQRAIKELRAGAIKFYPDSKRQELITYLNQLQDWNISRQIIWGIPIPIFQNQADKKEWIFDERVDLDEIVVDNQIYKRDPDVFDTWFSSGQWPFATLDWQNEPQFYPQSLMETGVDILRPWVSRMILLGLYITDQLPFKEVYLHGMIVDATGLKMSKSKGNVVNPMTIIEVYGADALRLSLCAQTTPGQPQRFSQTKILAGRNFCNKLWNIGRFIQNMESNQSQLVNIADHWLSQRFLETKNKSDQCLKKYQISLAWEHLYNFVWHDLADWYLESSKWQANPEFLRNLFQHTLRLLHPFTPFLTEALYQELYDQDSLLITDVWPLKLGFDPNENKASDFESIKENIAKIRQLLPLDLRRQSQLYFQDKAILDTQINQFYQRMTQIEQVQHRPQKPASCLIIDPKPNSQIWLSLEAKLIQKHLSQLQKQKQALDNQQKSLSQRLSNQAYLDKAPTHLIEESRQQQSHLKQQSQDLESQIAYFQA